MLEGSRPKASACSSGKMIAENSAGLLAVAKVEQVIDGAEYVLSAGGVLHERVGEFCVFYAGIVGHDDLCAGIGIFERAGQQVALGFRDAEGQDRKIKFVLLNGRGCRSES